ncbi:alpha-N-acetylglucosaminidase [Pochonia chlamydosporia 170]|uniref:Alpha-N-acetylglucosaminidase n=1 Tax=Pochonia chlamydosporia 170 TaxID=1380566 RepID=A0A179G232_METCM|nr:alpha-N-acetylglucosaminidase [Pochonia chlamydosporia 170]OAQ71433.1 alpha-N-acetylglucosaminidase [Pochonia chlamydosporia 170]
MVNLAYALVTGAALIFSVVANPVKQDLPPHLAQQAVPQSVDGIKGLANRLFGGHADQFEFSLTEEHERWSRWNQPSNDNYTVTVTTNGKIIIKGTTLSALARGLRHYATDTLLLDDYWFIGPSRKPPASLPLPNSTLTGASVVPWRYNLNTVTFSYTFVWYQWEDWEKLLDWAAWRGVNIQLAWVGYEKIFLESFRELGMTDAEILPFFSGPAFQAWNRFGNIRGSWGGVGDLTISWIEKQFGLQKKIVARMVDLGITPVLPAFPGFVPDAIKRVRPNAPVTRAPVWEGAYNYSRSYFISPLDGTSARLQNLFISKQIQAFGNVTNIYTLDQFNEMQPTNGTNAYLSSVSNHTYAALTAANPAAIWLMQGWLFHNSRQFWTDSRIQAYLGGVKDKTSSLILDLYSENAPQWQRTQGYYGRPWIWCQLHNWGGNMNLFGQISKTTGPPLSALNNSNSLVGFGISAEGLAGNEVVYDLLLDQAWSKTAINTVGYFQNWVSRRYSAAASIPNSLFHAWELLRKHVYDNTDAAVPKTPVSIYQLRPSLFGLNRTGQWPAPTKIHYDPAILTQVRTLMGNASAEDASLLNTPGFKFDLVDITRQAITNEFADDYADLVTTFKSAINNNVTTDLVAKGQKLLNRLESLDAVLSTNEHFTLEQWLSRAQSWADSPALKDQISLNARSQVTVWFVEIPDLNDYSARAWSGLVRSYYWQRWSIFVNGLIEAVPTGALNEKALSDKIRIFEKEWQYRGFNVPSGTVNARGT